MLGLMGAFAGGTMATTRDELTYGMGAKALPKPKVDKRAFRTAGGNPPSAATWLKPLAGYDRRQPREFQVTRFG
jgi:hypothetical protein